MGICCEAETFDVDIRISAQKFRHDINPHEAHLWRTTERPVVRYAQSQWFLQCSSRRIEFPAVNILFIDEECSSS